MILWTSVFACRDSLSFTLLHPALPWKTLAGDLKVGGECDLVVYSPSSLSSGSSWFGHSSSPYGQVILSIWLSLGVLVTSSPQAQGWELHHPLMFFLSLSQSFVLSLSNSPGLPSLVCSLSVAGTLSDPRDRFAGLLSTLTVYLYKSKTVFPLCWILVLVLQSLPR